MVLDDGICEGCYRKEDNGQRQIRRLDARRTIAAKGTQTHRATSAVVASLSSLSVRCTAAICREAAVLSLTAMQKVQEGMAYDTPISTFVAGRCVSIPHGATAAIHSPISHHTGTCTAVLPAQTIVFVPQITFANSNHNARAGYGRCCLRRSVLCTTNGKQTTIAAKMAATGMYGRSMGPRWPARS